MHTKGLEEISEWIGGPDTVPFSLSSVSFNSCNISLFYICIVDILFSKFVSYFSNWKYSEITIPQ